MSQNILTNTTTPPLAGSTAIGVLNQAADSLAKWFCGTAAPTAGAAGLTDLKGFAWHDTATNTLKVRDQADTTWIIAGYFDETNKVFTPNINDATRWAYPGGTANAYTASPEIPWASYVAGAWLLFQSPASNTGPSTLNVSGLGTKNIYRQDDSALQAGDLSNGGIYLLFYDGAAFRMVAPPISATTSTAGAVILAQASDVITGTNATKAVTPASLTANMSLSGNGYFEFPGGFLIQWGETASIANAGTSSVSFPKTFPNACAAVTLTPLSQGSVGQTHDNVTGVSIAGFTAHNNSNAYAQFYWIAVGY